MTADSGTRVPVLKVDGGATVNDLLMQLQADVLGVPVVRPQVAETTALGAAYAAGLAVGVWENVNSSACAVEGGPAMGPAVVRGPEGPGVSRAGSKAVSRSLDWV